MANNKCNMRKAEISVVVHTFAGNLSASIPILLPCGYSNERLTEAVSIFLRQYFHHVISVDVHSYVDCSVPFISVTSFTADRLAVALVSLITLQL